SDVDLRGVCVAPEPLRLSLFRSFEQFEGALPDGLAELAQPKLAERADLRGALDVKAECVVFDVAKFLRLCAVANPSALEVLFADERDWLFAAPAWRLIHDARERFLTKKVHHTFHGYAMAQLKKIRSHRAWLLSPPKAAPTRSEFGLPDGVAALGRDDRNRIEKAVADKVRGFLIDDVEMPKAARIAVKERVTDFYMEVLAASEEDLKDQLRAVATHTLSLPADLVRTLNAERHYRAALKHWNAFQAWKTDRNPARAELERRYGYDTKHAMHLVRLMRMGLEVLETGALRVRRDDAAELLAIRDGALSFDALLAEAERLEGAMQRAAEGTSLPADVDSGFVDTLCLNVIHALR
ncbi:MAG: nucleotidyltransferase domain-containing protein, partial [Myxococcota bacterium]